MSDLLTRTLASRWVLSERETEVLRLIVSGVTANKAIATALHVSESTVDKHIDSISRKSELSGRTELVSLLLRGLSALVESLDSPQGVGFADLRVLVIDDHEDVADEFARALRRNGFIVEVANSLEEAAQAPFNHGDFDVVVIDFVIPRGDGITAARRVREAGLGAPSVVMVTGYPDLYFNTEGVEDLHIVLKPVDPPTLARAVWSAAITARFRRRLWNLLQTA